MPTFRSTRPVRHSAVQMFDLVADVETYPEFLPLCEALRIIRRSQSGEGIETLVASMSIGYKAISESFTTRVSLDRPRLRILVEYVDGPFKYLENRWTFLDTAGRRGLQPPAFRTDRVSCTSFGLARRAYPEFIIPQGVSPHDAPA
jgi:coenzyme Q-binding protein COQ10